MFESRGRASLDSGVTRSYRTELTAPARVGDLAAVSVILRILLDQTGLGFAAVTRLTDTTWTACAVLDRIAYGLEAWGECEVSTTMCRTVVATRRPIVIRDASRDPVYRHHPAPSLFGFQSYVGVPILQSDGSVFGTICALDPSPKTLADPDLIPTLELFAELVATQLTAQDRLDALRESEERLGFALKAGRLGNWELDLSTGRLVVSDLFAQNFGLRGRDDLTDIANLQQTIHPQDLSRQQAAVARAVATGDDLDIECRSLWPDGSIHWIRITGNCVAGETGAAGFMVGLSLDVTERRSAEAALLHLAHHDPLTDLANRRCIELRIGEALTCNEARNQEGGGRATVALLCIDLDQFKAVNDTFGHAVGDVLLQAVAARLSACVPPEMLVARYGGDEFAVLVAEAVSTAQIEQLAQRILDSLAQPHDVDGRQIMVCGSIGIALAPDDALDTVKLWRNADAAMYRAKASGRGRYRFFETTMDTRRQFTEELGLALPFALERGEMRLHYQPIVDLLSGAPLCFEALLRWSHPLLGLLPPQDFIALAEQTGQIVRLGAWVLKEAAREAMRWPQPIAVSVNLSPLQFSGGDLVADVRAALSASGLEPGRLELEVTETALLQDSETNRKILDQLRAEGVRIVLDDFGTGYSSLEYLRRFKFDKMKIDKSLLRDLPDAGNGDIIVRGIIGLGGDLNIPITIEGVETESQLDFLRGTGCLQAQGFLFSRPVPAEEVPLLVAASLPRLAPPGRKRAARKQTALH
jgi:diguanylate cyclase (GGDEF)-like protein